MSCCCCCCGDDVNKASPKYSRSEKGRSCTDVICFLIFIIFLLGMTLITLIVGSNDGIKKLTNGFDSFGNICNFNNSLNGPSVNNTDVDTSNLDFVLFFDYTNPASSNKICTAKCPTELLLIPQQYVAYSLANNVSYCLYNVSIGKYDPKLCASLPILPAIGIANRCIPNVEGILEAIHSNPNIQKLANITSIEALVDTDAIKLAFVQLYQKLPQIGIVSLASLAITIVLVFMLRYIVRIMILVVLLGVSIGSISLTVYLWLTYHKQMVNGNPVIYNVAYLNVNINTYLFYSVLMTIFTVILLILLIVMRKRIELCIKLFAEAQKTLAAIPLLFLTPVFTYILLALFVSYWLVTAFLINSFGEYDNPIAIIYKYQFDRKTVQTIMKAYHFVGLVWISEFIIGCQSMLVASSVAKWYFTRPKTALGTPLLTALKRLFVFHLGSVALGSFLITLVRIPRYILMYINEKIKSAPGSAVAEFISKACICCLYCLEKFISFINYNAYTIIAIEGISFCSAAQKAFAIIVENAARVTTINLIGDFMLFLAKLAVTVASIILAIFYLDIKFSTNINSINDLTPQISQALPLVIVAVVAFLIAHCFFSVYEMVIDALLVCFCEDCRANDGTPERPYYMNSSLKEFIDESSTHITINN